MISVIMQADIRLDLSAIRAKTDLIKTVDFGYLNMVNYKYNNSCISCKEKCVLSAGIKDSGGIHRLVQRIMAAGEF